MSADLQGVIIRGTSGFKQIIELGPQLLAGQCNVTEPVIEFCTREKATDVDISGTIAEPASHLHQSVVHLGRTQEIADRKALKCKASGKFVSTDCNH